MRRSPADKTVMHIVSVEELLRALASRLDCSGHSKLFLSPPPSERSYHVRIQDFARPLFSILLSASHRLESNRSRSTTPNRSFASHR